jgi:sigma-B regulation protein RsbU (phosphoserine phosphatase)
MGNQRRPSLAEIAARFEERKAGPAVGPSPGGVRSVLHSLYELFTQDITREGLNDLLRRDPQATFQFFTRHVDFASLRRLPWHKRYPEMAARVFIALAYQLSPPRRIAFAVATLCLILGFIPRVAVQSGESQGVVVSFGANLYWLIAIAIFALLLLMELRDKLTLKADLEIARQIQSELVASGAYERGDFRIYSRMRPANTVGGDYCDVIELSGANDLAVVIGDVAGKGMPAALLMALFQGSLRTLITAGHRGADLITKLNEYLCSSIPRNTFVTFFYSEIDTQTGTFCYVNAGHNAPFHLKPGGLMERFPPSGMVLGVMTDTPFEAVTLSLAPGEQVLFFTDGVSEAANQATEEFGEERLGQLLLQHAQASQEDLLDTIVTRVLAFCDLSRPHDDMTMVSIRRGTEKAGTS